MSDAALCPTCGRPLDLPRSVSIQNPWPAVVTLAVVLIFMFGLIALFRLT